MKRAALYARFSSDLQRDQSIEDQLYLCRTHAARMGWQVVAEFCDRARSGASLIGRDGLMELVAASKLDNFDLVVVESLDRLSRDQEDLAGLHKRFKFGGIGLEAVHGGTADTVQIGVRSLLGSLFLEDLKNKTRRGMAGVVREGRNAGGKSYGYKPVPGKPGELVIVEHEAAIVRRVWQEYADGKPPRSIAATLNAENIPAPRGAEWRANTIGGHAGRGHPAQPDLYRSAGLEPRPHDCGSDHGQTCIA
jgi:DNA invertase Pin-like site-specific DNA recombinase